MRVARGGIRRKPLQVSRPLALAALERGTLAHRTSDAIRLLILRGAVTPGQRIEPMRELAAELGVSVSVVREAISRLEGEGLLQVKHGRGTYVTQRQSAARSLRAVRMRAYRREAAELRQSVDPAVARGAARRASPESISELHFRLGERRLAVAHADLQTFTDADIAFHLAVARASGNGLAIGIHRMGARVLRSDLQARAARHARNHELHDLHLTLFEAIDLGQQGRAERAARAIAAIEARPP